MRQIILALIALVALGTLMQAAWAEPAKPVGLSDKLAPSPEPAQNTLYTTPSIADFLSASWASSAYVPDVFYASASPKSLNGTIASTTYAFTISLTIATIQLPVPPLHCTMHPHRTSRESSPTRANPSMISSKTAGLRPHQWELTFKLPTRSTK